MKKLLILLAMFANVSWAVDAYYRHHQRTATTSLEADLVAREIGIDASARNSIIAKKADGNLIHVLSQEMDTASLNGVLNVAGQTNLSGAVKMANYTSGRVPYFSTGGLITDASTLTYNGTTLAVNSGTYSGTLGITGVTSATGGLTLGAAFVDKTTLALSNTTLGATHSTIIANAVSGSFTLTLPAVSGNTGLTYTIYKTDGTTNTVTVDPSGTEIIGNRGASSTVILGGNSGNSVLKIICDGSQWFIEKLYDEGTVVLTATGFTTTPTPVAYYVINHDMVTLTLGGITATSNATTFTFTGLPAHLQATTASGPRGAINTCINNAARTWCSAAIVNSGTVAMEYQGDASGWTNSGSKGFSRSSISYNRKSP